MRSESEQPGLLVMLCALQLGVYEGVPSDENEILHTLSGLKSSVASGEQHMGKTNAPHEDPTTPIRKISADFSGT